MASRDKFLAFLVTKVETGYFSICPITILVILITFKGEAILIAEFVSLVRLF